MIMSPNLYIIAGPNGAGKTTFATKFLPTYADCKNFINADLIPSLRFVGALAAPCATSLPAIASLEIRGSYLTIPAGRRPSLPLRKRVSPV